MAPHWPQEVDVFSEPHSRMKKLVHKYSKMVYATDFSDEFHMRKLLQNLVYVFYEFKAHEHIENILIMRNLKRKLKAACVTSAAVCNCHSDNRLTDMLEMVVHGLRSRWTEKSVKERQSYGHKLQKALEDFTENFIPHMEEEEEVFQPMLMQYFSYEELKELKAKVIHEHYVSTTQEKFVEDFYQSEESTNVKTKASKHFDLLPDEICEKVFSYLNPQDLGRVAQTCQRWNRLAKDPALWTGIFPVHWAAGNWTFDPEPLGGVDGAGELDDTLMIEMDPVVCYDEDADVDESSSCGDDKDYYDEGGTKDGNVLKEAKLMSSLVKYLLPVVGSGVKVVDLAFSRGVNSSLVHKILKLCPNVEVLDLTHTQVCDSAFYEYSVSNRQSKLRHLDLTSCHNITDQTLFSLVGMGSSIHGHDWGTVAQQETAPHVNMMNNQQEKAEEVEIENAVLCCQKEQTNCCNGKSRSSSVSSVLGDALDNGVKMACDGGCKKSMTKVESSFGEKCNQTIGFEGENSVNQRRFDDVSDPVVHDLYESCDNIDIWFESISLRDNLNTTDRSHDRLGTTSVVDDFSSYKLTTSDSLDQICSNNNETLHNDFTGKNEATPSISLNSCCKSQRNDQSCSSKKKRCPSSTCSSSSYSECERDSHPSSFSSSSPQSPGVMESAGFSSDINAKTCCDKPFSFTGTVVDDSCCIPSSDSLCLSTMPDKCCTVNSDDRPHQMDSISLKPIFPDVEAALPVRPLTRLKFLSLNGCYLVSDQGLEALSYCGGTPSLGHLDLSGCLGLTGAGIQRLVSTCSPEFDHAQLFYCDNIPSDPYPTTASGCRNLGCGTRFCCSVD